MSEHDRDDRRTETGGEPMRLRARLSAPVPRVHAALTDPAALRAWLAEHAEVDPPERYEFWGRHTPDGDGPRQRLLHLDDRTLRFSWRLDGRDTTVEITLDPGSDGTTVLTLSQTDFPGWAEAMTTTSVLGVLHTFWSLAIANLADHLDGRELTPKCDFTSPRQREQVVIDAPPQSVFDSLVDPEQFRRWFGAKIEIEPHVGGRWAMGGFDADPDPAKIVELEPGRKMTVAWGSMVAGWELADTGGKTRLTFVQSGFDEQSPPYGAWMGWLSGIAELRRFHEVPDWRPVALDFEAPGLPEGMVG